MGSKRRLLATYRQAHERFPRLVPRWVKPQSKIIPFPSRVKEEKKFQMLIVRVRAELLGSERHFLMETTL